MTINVTTLKKYAKEGYNVLLSGGHGVGKTAIIKEVFASEFGNYGENWLYYSASTMDPWVDFIGIPKNYTNDKGQEVFKIIPPEHLTGEEKIEALFFDEINRADEKTLNALMELIQFRSINGRKFPYLKCIWAAENPHDDQDHEYSVKPLDPAQRDRFQIQLNVPYELNKKYFTDKYGSEFFDISQSWWNKNKKIISPRKLDDMLQGHLKGFSLIDFSNKCSTIRELQFNLNAISDMKQIRTIAESGDADAIMRYFTLDKIRSYEKILKKERELISKFFPHVDQETQKYIENKLGFYMKTDLDLSLFTKEQADFISKYRAKKTISELSKYTSREFINVAIEFPFTLDNIPISVTDYSGEVDNLFPFKYNSQTLGSYDIRDMFANMGKKDIEEVKNFITVLLYMLNLSHHSSKPENTNAFSAIKKLSGSSFFNAPTNLDKKRFNKIVKNIASDDVPLSIDEFKKGLFL
jgi:hypothetical protein